MFDTLIKLISKCTLRCVKRVSKVPALFCTYSLFLSTRPPSSTPFGWGGLKNIIIPSLSPLLIYSHIPCARTTSSTPPLPLASSHLLAPPMWSHHLIHSICLGGIKKNNHPVLLASSPPAMVCYARLGAGCDVVWLKAPCQKVYQTFDTFFGTTHSLYQRLHFDTP